MENDVRNVNPDWESEFYKADQHAKKLYMKLKDTEEKARCLREEILRYETIIKTMEFIVGRKFEE